MWSFYIPSMVGVVLACTILLRRFAAPRVHWFARLLVLLGWITSISIVALVPIDVWATLKATQNHSINIMWSISYWSTQMLTWVLIPLASGFFDAGDFTFFGRFRQAVKDRIIYFSSLGVAAFFIVGILLLMGKLVFKDLLKWAMVLANTYGLVAGILLLGFGLVAIPRSLWRSSDPEASFRWALYQIGQAAEKLEDAALDVQRVATVVEATSKSMSARDPLRPYMNLIYQQAEAESPVRPSQAVRDGQGRVNLDNLTEGDLDHGAEKRGLAKLRRRLTRIVYKFNGLRSKYEASVAEGVALQAICKSRKNKDYFPLDSPAKGIQGTLAEAWLVFQCVLRPWLQKLLSLSLAAASFMLIWSEATIGSGRNPDLSPFSHMIGHGVHGEVSTQLLTALPLAYMCGSAYYSLFKLVIFSYYRMVPRATDPISLLLNAGQVCRFAAPLAYNFMHVIRMNEKTVFATKMGTAMDVVKLPFFGADFNTWFPLTVVIYTLLLYLNIWDAIVGVCLPKRFRFSQEEGDDEHTERGKTLLRQEQEASLRGQAVGECLGLWGSPEAPGLSPGATVRLSTSRSGKMDSMASSGSQKDLYRSSPTAFQIQQPAAAPQPSASSWGWPLRAAKAPPEMTTPTPSTLSRAPSRRPSQSGGSRGAHSRVNSSNQLDDIFNRMEPADTLGRIDDPSSPQGSLNWSQPATTDSPRSAWNRVWR